MTAKKKKPLMDHDPLEWVENEQEEPSEALAEKPPVTEGSLSEIKLEESEKMERASELHETFLQALEKNEDINIDASAVKLIDAAALQLLVLLFQEAVKQGLSVTIVEPSESFIEAATLLGLNDLFGL